MRVVSALLFVTMLGQTAWASVGSENLLGRRTIRGTTIDVAVESSELKALRDWEEGEFSFTLGATDAPCEGDACSVPGWRDAVVLPDFPVRLEGRVNKYIEYFTADKRGRATMSKWLGAQARFANLIRRAINREHLPESLMYVAMVESGYSPFGKSRVGAQGLWQWMARGAGIYGLRVDFWVDERRDPERSTDAVMRYFHDLKDRFGSWSLVLAAFNAGYGAVLKSIRAYNTNSFWELCEHENSLPWETQLYVPKVFAAAVVGNNRKLFGFDEVQGEVSYDYDTVTVNQSMSLGQMAKAANVTTDQIERLNPELRRKRTPPGEAWRVRLPKGASPSFLAHVKEFDERLKVVELRQGERLEDLAKKNGTAVKELRALNGIDDAEEVKAGLRLVVPGGRHAQPIDSAALTVVAVPDKTLALAHHQQVFYRVVAGDSLAAIARRFAVQVRDVVAWNGIDPDAALVPQQVLAIWIKEDCDTTKIVLLDPAHVRLVTRGSEEFFDLLERERGRVRVSHTVKKGDRWETVAKQFGLSVADLERINRRSAGEPLTPGQTIIGYRAMSAEEKSHREKITAGGTEVTSLEPPVADPRVGEGIAGEESAESDDQVDAPENDKMVPPVSPKTDQP